MSPTSRMRPADDVFSRTIDGEVVLLDLRKGLYYGLDSVGSLAWEGMSEGKSVREIAKNVTDSFDIDETTAMNDLLALASEWLDKELVVSVE